MDSLTKKTNKITRKTHHDVHPAYVVRVVSAEESATIWCVVKRELLSYCFKGANKSLKMIEGVYSEEPQSCPSPRFELRPFRRSLRIIVARLIPALPPRERVR